MYEESISLRTQSTIFFYCVLTLLQEPEEALKTGV